MSGIPRLEVESPAYIAYLSLDRVPSGAPKFDTDINGYPIVMHGECICRMPALPGTENKLCGLRYIDRKVLLTHIENKHNVPNANRPRLSISRAIVAQAMEFYRSLMKHEDYPGKSVDESTRTLKRELSGVKSRI